MQTIKSADEILKDNGIYPGFRSTYTYDGIVKALHEYHAQFKEQPISESLPKEDKDWIERFGEIIIKY